LFGRWRRGLTRMIRRRRSLRRELWVMEAALTADAPKLASMFEVFNLLTRYERPVGIEPLASSAPLVRAPLMTRGSGGAAGPARPRRVAALATLLAVAVVLGTCLAIAIQIRPSARSCLDATPAGLGYSASRVPGCTPYPLKK
jgi:hypothetical protein